VGNLKIKSDNLKQTSASLLSVGECANTSEGFSLYLCEGTAYLRVLYLEEDSSFTTGLYQIHSDFKHFSLSS